MAQQRAGSSTGRRTGSGDMHQIQWCRPQRDTPQHRSRRMTHDSGNPQAGLGRSDQECMTLCFVKRRQFIRRYVAPPANGGPSSVTTEAANLMVGEAIMQGVRTQDWDWLRAGRGFHSDRPCANPVVTVHRRRRNVEQSRAWGQFGGVSAPSASRHCWGTSVAHSRLQPSPSSRRTPTAADWPPLR